MYLSPLTLNIIHLCTLDLQRLQASVSNECKWNLVALKSRSNVPSRDEDSDIGPILGELVTKPHIAVGGLPGLDRGVQAVDGNDAGMGQELLGEEGKGAVAYSTWALPVVAGSGW